MTDPEVKWLGETDEELGTAGIAVLALVVLVMVWLSYCVAAAYAGGGA